MFNLAVIPHFILHYKHYTKNEVFNYNFLRIWSHLLKKSLMKNFIFCAVKIINKYLLSEAVVPRCSIKKLFLESSQNSKENTSVRVSFLIKGLLAQILSCEFCEIFKNNFFHGTPSVAASILSKQFPLLLYYFF